MTNTTEELHNLNATPGERFSTDDNAFGLSGIEHVALPSLDIDLMARFLREVLGGEPYYVAGYDDVDREMGRQKHFFMRIGGTLVQSASPRDGELKIGKDDTNGWPHWAFGVTAEGMLSNVARLRSLGIPVFGPVRHRGVDAVSAYFTSPEGHKLELCTYDEMADEATIGVAGAAGVPHPEWDKLFHDWPEAKAPEA